MYKQLIVLMLVLSLFGCQAPPANVPAVPAAPNNFVPLKSAAASIVSNPAFTFVRGTINADGTLVGENFSMENLSEGNFKITFSNPFQSIPSVNVSLMSGPFIVIVTAISTTDFFIMIFTPDQVPLNAPFSFIVIGL